MIDACVCLNGGTCTSTNNLLGNKCQCPGIYTGAYCETREYTVTIPYKANQTFW